MSRGIAIYSLCCMVMTAFVTILTVVSLLADGEVASAFLTVVLIAPVLYGVIFVGGVMILNVLGVASQVIGANVYESRRIRGKE